MLISQIDFVNQFKNDPDNGVSTLLFSGSDKDFDKFIFDTIRTPNTTNTWDGPDGPLIDLTFYGYVSGSTSTTTQSNKIDFKINSNYDNKSFSKFLLDFMSSIELFSKEQFMTTLLEGVFGIISSRTEVTKDQLIDDEKLNKLSKKILDVDPCYDEIVYDDSFFTFNDDELSDIEKNAIGRKLGIMELDLGCGVYEFDLATESPELFTLLNEMKDNKYNPSLQERKTSEILHKIDDIASKKSPKNAESIKDKFNKDLIKELPKTLVKSSFNKPTVVAITNMANYITTLNKTLQETSFDFAIFNRSFFEYIVRESWAVLVEILFSILKREILKLIKKIVKKIIKKIAKKKADIIKSYTKETTGGETEGLLTSLPQPESLVT